MHILGRFIFLYSRSVLLTLVVLLLRPASSSQVNELMRHLSALSPELGPSLLLGRYRGYNEVIILEISPYSSKKVPILVVKIKTQ